MQHILLALLTSVAVVNALPAPSLAVRDPKAFQKQNGLAAQTLNRQFAKLNKDDACNDGSQACINGGFAQCVSGKWAITACSGGTTCFALPLVNKSGTSLACDTPNDALARFMAAGVDDGTGASDDVATATQDGIESSSDASDNGQDTTNGSDGATCGDEDAQHNARSRDNTSCSPDSNGEGVNNPNLGSNPSINGSSSIIILNPASSTPSSTVVLHRRQGTSGFSSVQVSDASSPSASIVTPSTPISNASAGAVLGPDGIATLTVVSTIVSTVTVFMSFVPVSTSGAATFAPGVPIGSSIPSVVPSPTLSSSNTLLPSFPSVSVSSAESAASSAGSTSSAISSIASASLSNSAASQTPFQGFSFETTVAPAPTAPPTNNNGIATNSPIDISSLLTATVVVR